MISDYFKNIDTELKAYWIGYIWGDGYVSKQDYRFVLAAKKSDEQHLQKLATAIEYDKPCKTYNYHDNAYKSSEPYVQLQFCNKEFCCILKEQYGIIPHRTDCAKLLASIPDEFIRHFVRGLMDADGSFTHYNITYNGYTCNKYVLSLGSNETMLRHIEQHFISAGLIGDYKRKLYKRHKEENRDGAYRTLQISGRCQVMAILDYLYGDCSCFLDRKYNKYMNIKNK